MLDESLRTRSRERDALLARMYDVLAADHRVRASWIEGSVGRGEDDGFSDLDVGVVIADHDVPLLAGPPDRPMTYTALTSSPRARFAAAVTEPLLVMEAPHNAPQGGAFLSTFVSGSQGPTRDRLDLAAALGRAATTGLPHPLRPTRRIRDSSPARQP